MISNLRPVNTLQDTPHDVLARIFEFIAVSDGNYLHSNKKYTEEDVKLAHSYLFEGWWRDSQSDEAAKDHINKIIDRSNVRYSMKKLSSPPSSPVASLNGIAALFRSLSLVSKRINQFCTFFLTNVLIDADFFGVSKGHELGCILWMIKKRLKLSRIRAKTNLDASHLLATLLVHCNTSELRACDVKFSGDSLIRAAWFSKFQAEEVDLISDTTILSSRSLNEYLWDLGVSRADYLHANMSEDDFFKVLSSECPSIEILAVTMEIDPYETRLDSRHAALMSSPSLKYVDIHIRLPRSVREGRYREAIEPKLLFPGLTKAIALSPNLRGLRISSNPFLSDKYGLSIESDSLEVIDMVDAHKNTFVLHCRCPKLQTFFSGTRSPYNGVLPLDFDMSQRNWAVFWNDTECLPASRGFIGFAVPPDCMIHLTSALYCDA